MRVIISLLCESLKMKMEYLVRKMELIDEAFENLLIELLTELLTELLIGPVKA